MQSLNYCDCFKSTCALYEKWGLYLYYDQNTLHSDLLLAAPFISFDDYMQDNRVFLFDTEEECNKYFNMVIGDDGPTESNKYDGECRVYALTCDPLGVLRNENT